jgi:hypothetical protein
VIGAFRRVDAFGGRRRSRVYGPCAIIGLVVLALLETLNPKARDDLRRVLIRDQADRDAISSLLLRYRDEAGNDWTDIVDLLTSHPDTRRWVVRMLAEIDAGTP